MTQHDIEVDHEDKIYLVKVDVEWKEVDDSFDHEFGTEHLSHYEPEDWDIISCVDTDTDKEVDPELIDGLCGMIGWQVRKLEHPYE